MAIVIVTSMRRDEFKKLRESVGYTQVELAKAFGVYVRSISRWETGEFPVPKMAELALRYIVDQVRKKDK
jgi:DNA-binding transcriptional regulator YiaG